MTQILKRINLEQALKGRVYTPEEIDKHEDARNIWATIFECKREAQVMVSEAYDNGYWHGQHG